MNKHTEVEEIVDRICSIRKGSMDNKQFKATVRHNMDLALTKAREEERERIIRFLIELGYVIRVPHRDNLVEEFVTTDDMRRLLKTKTLTPKD